MSDMRLNMTNTPMVNDTKNRSSMDMVAAEMSNSQFLDMMMTRIASLKSDDAELNALVQKVDRNRGTDTADNKALLQRLKDVQKNDAAERTDAVMKKSDVKKKIQERIKQIADSHGTVVEDKKALKAMQKTAKALLKANDDGEIALPKEIAQKLEEFLAKGDEFKALDIINFAQEFNDMFRNLVIAMPNGDAAAQGAWPQEMVDAFAEAGLENFVAADKPADAMNMMRALRALMNEGRMAANAALDTQAKAALEGTVAAPEMMAADAVATDGMDVKAELQAGTVTKPVAKAEGNESKTLTDIMMDAAAPNRNEDKPDSDKTASDDDAPRQGREGRADAAAAKPQDARTTAMVNEIKAAVAAQAQGQPASAAATPSAANTAAVDATLIGVDQGGVSAPAAARAAFTAEVNAAERGKPSLPTQQVMMQIQTKGTNKPTQIAVQLTPVELGRVEVRLSIARDGQTHAVVVADKPETLALLQKDSTHLERALQQAGLDTNAGSMSFNLREEHQPSQFGQGRKRFSRDAIGEVATKEATMHIQPEAIISDTRINYHA